MKAKKIMAVLMTSAMLIGTAIPAFAAAGETPVPGDAETVSVQNVDLGATVTAYQIVAGDYNDYGFIGYESVTETVGETEVALVANPLKPTSTEVSNIASRINSNNLTLKSVPLVDLKDGATDGIYEADLNPGYWIVLVRTVQGNAKIYNPMLVSVRYSVGGDDNTMESGNVNAEDTWSLVGDSAWAKSSDVPFSKTAKDTANFGEDVTYTINTTIPAYGLEYTNVTFSVTDTLATDDLKLSDGSIAVQYKNGDTFVDVPENMRRITGNVADSTTFTVTFESDWILANTGKEIQISYDAEVTPSKVNTASHDNAAELTYTNNPGTTATKTDTEKVYSFDIDGDVTGEILQKVDDKNQPLNGAEFTLYTNESCTNKYTNSYHLANVPTATTNTEGIIHITGLDVGTYYLKETKAPNDFTLNDTVYKIEVKATITDENLTAWNIIVTDLETNKVIDNGFTVNGGSVTEGADNETTVIKNTRISELPSTGGIGTTIFTIGGCVIMIVAAGMFFASRRKEEN